MSVLTVMYGHYAFIITFDWFSLLNRVAVDSWGSALLPMGGGEGAGGCVSRLIRCWI